MQYFIFVRDIRPSPPSRQAYLVREGLSVAHVIHEVGIDAGVPVAQLRLHDQRGRMYLSGNPNAEERLGAIEMGEGTMFQAFIHRPGTTPTEWGLGGTFGLVQPAAGGAATSAAAPVPVAAPMGAAVGAMGAVTVPGFSTVAYGGGGS